MDRDQADGLFRCERPQPFLHLAGGKAKTSRADEIDAYEIAVLGTAAIGPRDIQLAAGLLFVDRNKPASAARQRAENSEHACLRVIDDLDNPSAIDRRIGHLELFDPQ